MSGDALSQDPAEMARRIDTTKAHSARVYDVFLGGKDNYPVDRAAAAAALAPTRAGTSMCATTATSCAGR